MNRSIAVLACLALSIACSKSSPSSPSDPGGILEGQTVNAVDGAASPGVSVRVASLGTVTSDDRGFFQVDVGGPGVFNARLRGGAFVDRETSLAVPSAGRLRVSLIPASFDMAAFNEMFRGTNDRLQRWITRPSLVVLGTAMIYRSSAGNDYEASAEQLTDDEVGLMLSHLREGLALLTGSTFEDFESVAVERPAAGTRVNVMRHGFIVAGRYIGVAAFTNTIGYGQWSESPSGAINGGAMYLDRDFDRGDARRRLLRIHELGHALGYQHVRSRTSIMNPAVGPEPTDFDRAGAIIAFQRLPGNRAPDVDPSGANGPLSISIEGGRWAPPVFCK